MKAQANDRWINIVVNLVYHSLIGRSTKHIMMISKVTIQKLVKDLVQVEQWKYSVILEKLQSQQDVYNNRIKELESEYNKTRFWNYQKRKRIEREAEIMEAKKKTCAEMVFIFTASGPPVTDTLQPLTE